MMEKCGITYVTPPENSTNNTICPESAQFGRLKRPEKQKSPSSETVSPLPPLETQTGLAEPDMRMSALVSDLELAKTSDA
jgi:hypothetical protein